MADKQSLVQRLNPRLRNPMLKVESVVAFRECWLRHPWASAWDGAGTFHWRVKLPVAALPWVPLAVGTALRVSVRTRLSQRCFDGPCGLGEAARTRSLWLERSVFSSEPICRGTGRNPPSCRGKARSFGSPEPRQEQPSPWPACRARPHQRGQISAGPRDQFSFAPGDFPQPEG